MEKIRLENQPVGPFPGMIVGAMVNQKPTFTTVGAGGCACMEPVLCVSLKNTHYITQGIEQSGFFSVNIPPVSLVRQMDFCGITSGWNTDKSGVFRSFFDEAGSAPMIEECSLNFLCKLCQKTEIRGFTMFFGEIAAAFASQDCLAQGALDPIKADPIIMIGRTYCGLKNVIGQPFVEGKKLSGPTD